MTGYCERPTLILLVGLPGSGKSTWANDYKTSHKDTVIMSSDSIRKELYGDESIQDNPEQVFALMQKRTIEHLANGKNVIYDATNITRKSRAGIIAAVPAYVKVVCTIIWQPVEECLKRDALRSRTVGKEVIDKMLKRFQAPFYDEGIDIIDVVLPENFDHDLYAAERLKAIQIPHDNPHHTLDIYNHCIESRRYFISNYLSTHSSSDYYILMPALAYHDIGKAYVKTFIDKKSNTVTSTAHYYQHQCVGAYFYYGCKKEESNEVKAEVAWLISTHMDPFLNTKYYKNLPAYLKKKIDILHDCDLHAH